MSKPPLGEFVSSREMDIPSWEEALETDLGEKSADRLIKERLLEALARQNSNAVDQLAILKAEAVEVLQRPFPEELLLQKADILARRAANEALECAFTIEKLGNSFLLSENAPRILREAVNLGRAMFRIELWTERWPSVERLREQSQRQKTRLKINSSKAVIARQKKAEERRLVCRHLAREHTGKGSISQAASSIRKIIRSKNLLKELPSHSTIVSDIRDLFSARTRKPAKTSP